MGRCRRHPHHLVVGVCAYCLNEHLTALLEKLEDYEDPDINFPSHYMSPIALTSSNPSTSCGGTVPETPLSVTRRAHKTYFGIDDITPRASSNQFSLPFSPLHRPESQNNATSSNLSPQNQVFLGNQDFIKGEIPRKSKSAFWSFLHRRKDGYFAGCGMAHGHHDYGLEDLRNDHIHNDGIQAHGFHRPSTSSRMCAQCEKGRLDKQILSKMLSSSMREVQPGSSCRENLHVSSLHTPQSPKKAYHQRLSPSKQEYFHSPSSVAHTIRRSPLRRETHGDEEEFSGGLHGNYSSHAHYPQGSQRNIDDSKNRFGSSSSWISSLFPQKIRRSKSISGLNDVGLSGPSLGHACRASPDAEPTRARLVSFADEAGVIKCMPVKVSRSRNVFKGDNRQSSNMHMHAPRQSKSPKSSSFHGYFGKGSSDAAAYALYTNHAHSPKDFSSFEAKAHSSPRLVKPISSLFSKKRSETVSIDCGKDSRVSPIAMLAMKRQSSKSPHSPFSDEYVSPHHRNQVRHFRQHVDGTVPRCSPNFECLDDSSTMVSDDEFRRSPMSAMKEHTQSPKLAPIKTKCAKGQDEHYGNQDLYSYSTTSWSKALKKTLAPMLGIGRGKKQCMKRQDIAHNDPNHGVQQCMDETHEYNAHIQNARHDDHDYVIDLNRHCHDDRHYQHSHRSIKAHVKESHVLPGLDTRGPPQQYSFLSRDYSAFSFYFSPRQAYGSAEEASYSSHKPVQAGTGEFCAAKP